MGNVINFGIWGVGRMGRVHYRCFSEMADKYRPVAFCDVDIERARALADDCSGKAYEAAEEFLADPAMDLVIIATRSLDHVMHATMALAAGKRVLLEKPIAVTAEDYKNLQKLVKKYPDRIYFGQNHRFEPAHAMAYDIVQQGLLGKLHTVKITKVHPFAPRCDWQMMLEHGGGQLSVWGPHVIDQTLHFLGAPVKSVWSSLRSILTPGDADDHFRLIITAENGVEGEIEVSNAIALEYPYCIVCGDRGTLRYNGDQREIELRYLDPEFKMPKLEISAATPQKGAWHKIVDLPWITETRTVEYKYDIVTSVEVAMAEYLYAALNGTGAFPVTSEEALEVVRVTELAKNQNSQYKWLQ